MESTMHSSVLIGGTSQKTVFVTNDVFGRHTHIVDIAEKTLRTRPEATISNVLSRAVDAERRGNMIEAYRLLEEACLLEQRVPADRLRASA